MDVLYTPVMRPCHGKEYGTKRWKDENVAFLRQRKKQPPIGIFQECKEKAEKSRSRIAPLALGGMLGFNSFKERRGGG